MTFVFIDARKATVPVSRLCRTLGVSVSGYYAWKKRPASCRQRDDLLLLAHARSICARSRQTYGSRRIRHDLQAEGPTVGRHRIARLMQDNGLKALQKARFKKATDNTHDRPVAPNLLD